jgi:hypothetical protein
MSSLVTAVTQMIAVRMGNDDCLYKLPRIDVEIAWRTVKTSPGNGDQGFDIGRH